MSALLGPAGLLGGGRRLAVAAVALYAVVSVGVALPPTAGRVALLSVAGTAAMVVGVRSNRAVLVGAAVALAAGGWALRPALDVGGLGGEVGTGRWVSGLVLGIGLLACFELARLAVDAGPRHGPVRVEAALRRASERRFGIVTGLGALGAAVAFIVTGGGHASAPALFLPLGILAVAAVIVLVVVLVGATLPAPTAAASSPGRPRGRDRGRRSVGPSRRALVGLVVAGALALPAARRPGGRGAVAGWRAVDGGGVRRHAGRGVQRGEPTRHGSTVGRSRPRRRRRAVALGGARDRRGAGRRGTAARRG